MQDLADLMDPALHLPIAGTDYAIECTAWQGLHLQRIFSDGLSLNDERERAEIVQMLGTTYQQMLDDGLSWPKIAVAGRTAIFWFGHSEKLGQAIWEGGGLPGNPIPPSPRQTAMGEKLRKMFRRPEPTDRMILAAARMTP